MEADLLKVVHHTKSPVFLIMRKTIKPVSGLSPVLPIQIKREGGGGVEVMANFLLKHGVICDIFEDFNFSR